MRYETIIQYISYIFYTFYCINECIYYTLLANLSTTLAILIQLSRTSDS